MSTSTTDTTLLAGDPMPGGTASKDSGARGLGTRLPAVARALERGQLEEAKSLLTQADYQQIETRLLRARLLFRQGDVVQALREIEQARAEAPSDGRVYGVASEIYVGLGRLDEADQELRRGLKVDGACAAMERARGVYLLQLPGAARTARIHLLQALELEPDLAFTARPLAAAHKLAGRAYLREQNPLEAVRAARAGLELYPDDFDLRELHADALLAVGSLRHAVAIFEELLAEGHPVENDLSLAAWRAGMGELIARRRAAALDYFTRARELGMSDEGLGSALHLMSQESMTRVGRGIAAYGEDELEQARGLFAEAVHLDPNNLAAMNHLAVTHARLGMSELAIEGWTQVLGVFDEADGTPPEPIHLNLARTLLEVGGSQRARQVLQQYEPAAMQALGEEPTDEELAACLDRLESSHRSSSLKRAE